MPRSKQSANPVTTSLGSAASTIGGPASGMAANAAPCATGPSIAALSAKQAGTQQVAQAMSANPLKAVDHGLDAGHAPTEGPSVEAPSDAIGGSTLSETNPSDNAGGAGGAGRAGFNANHGVLDAARVDSGGQALTTNQGVLVADNQNSLKAGLRGPTLLEDFILREKITHFDHERIPERIVHARGSAAHGYFECERALGDITKAAPFAQKGKRTPVFVRFSTVAGERGSTDTARDVRGKPEKFADHYSQATLFFDSQSAVEQNHIVAALRFELTRVQTPAVRARTLALLRNIDETLAARVADGLGMELPPALPRALEPPVKAEVDVSAALSLLAFPGDGSIAGRRIAILVADGADAKSLQPLVDALVGCGAGPRYIGAKLGKVKAAGGGSLEIEATLETMPSPIWDALVIDASADALAEVGSAVEFVKEQFRHCKTILVSGAATAAFIKAVGQHRHYEREKDPSPV